MVYALVAVDWIFGGAAEASGRDLTKADESFIMIAVVMYAVFLVIAIIVKCSVIHQIQKARHIIDQVKMQSAVGV